MKTQKLYKFLAILFIATSVVSCIEDTDYEIPSISEDKKYENLKPLNEIIALYNNSNVDFKEYIKNSGLKDINTYGYVISNDRSGNFFKTIKLQDKPENPTVAVEIVVNTTNLNAMYNVGRKVYIKLNGLALGKRFENFQIGLNGGNSIDRIGENDYTKFLDRSKEITDIVPTILTIATITDAHLNTLIKLEGMQSENKGETFANPSNNFSVNRNFKNCDTNEKIVMRTSGYASFKGIPIPEKKGSITAILGKFGNTYQLYIRDVNDLKFTENRCDPLFEDSFSSNNFSNWTVKDVKGNESWEVASFGNPAPSAKISGFKSGAKENEDWLISKKIDLSSVSGATFTFESVKRYNGDDIEVFYSTNYNGGNPNDAANNWTKLNPTLDTNTGSWTSWTGSGDLDVSAAAGGNLYIAFKYTSTTSGAATFEIDNVKVAAK